MTSFEDLGLIPELLAILDKLGYKNPTPIQEGAIPAVLSCRDVLGIAQTGTGKTASFSLPVIQRIAPWANHSFSPAKHPPRVLILEPTRELALQVCDAVDKFAPFIPLRSCAIFGGMHIDVQSQALREGREIIVATPGRLLDHLRLQNIRCQEIGILILDEVDCMLDMGFLPDITRIIGHLPSERQNLLFSATISPEIDVLAQKILRNPIRVQVSELNSVADTIDHVIHVVSDKNRQAVLLQLLRQNNKKTLIFVETKDVCTRLAQWLSDKGLLAAAIHGDRSQKERVATLEAFKTQDVDILIATDIAARGLDISDLLEVINFSLPQSSESYVHRIGRTGRRGQKGIARSLITPQDEKRLKEIENLIGKKIKRISLEDSGNTSVSNTSQRPINNKSRTVHAPAPDCDDANFVNRPYIAKKERSCTVVSPFHVKNPTEKKKVAALFQPHVKPASAN
ncbi:DEAD/DEAH box helicase [Candidatus Ichthyocystis hellenicum]|uniref:DEAD/DEAH box helicase n=1 Tax=Candidatus Ichthyocystis hellenicum TaxID=1561003 RepID=UPI000A6E81E2|nr:DEAD/DEAH box helicase [Candidatus Ichthyocystis hellenicum]